MTESHYDNNKNNSLAHIAGIQKEEEEGSTKMPGPHPKVEREKTKPWIQTPLVESAVLSRAAGCRIFLKLENLQPSGSFKSRAMGELILHNIAHYPPGTKLHFFASSGGNAGMAAVCAARSLSYPCTVVLPVTTSPLMVAKLQAAGATEVIQHGETIAEAGEYMKNVVMIKPQCEEDGLQRIALHPFDHEAIWEGNSSIIDELVEQLPIDDDIDIDDSGTRKIPVDAIICSVGGGGLMNGLIRGIERYGNSASMQKKDKDIHILAAETEGTASLALAVDRQSLVSLPRITSLATSLGCVRVSAQTFDYAVSPPRGVAVHSVVLSDSDAARGALRLADDERMLVELACGVCIETAVGEVRTTIHHEKQNRQHCMKRKRCSTTGDDEGYSDENDNNINNTNQNRNIDNNKCDSERPSTFFVDSALASSEDGEGEEVDNDILPPSQQLSRLKQIVPSLTRESRVVIIVCGGSNVTIGMAEEWRQKLECGWD